MCQIREYVGASICIRVTKPSPGRTIGSEGFMGGGVGWVLVQPAAPMGCHCLRGRAMDATKYIERGSRERITNQNRSFLGKLPKA